MSRHISLLALLLMLSMSAMAKTEKATVLFSVNLHCEGCINKIEKNIAFEKGVKDIRCDLEKKTVLVTYDASKTDVKTLQTVFEKIGKPATVVAPEGALPKPDAVSGASQVTPAH